MSSNSLLHTINSPNVIRDHGVQVIHILILLFDLLLSYVDRLVLLFDHILLLLDDGVTLFHFSFLCILGLVLCMVCCVNLAGLVGNVSFLLLDLQCLAFDDSPKLFDSGFLLRSMGIKGINLLILSM